MKILHNILINLEELAMTNNLKELKYGHELMIMNDAIKNGATFVRIGSAIFLV